jgi:hypothetical protein
MKAPHPSPRFDVLLPIGQLETLPEFSIAVLVSSLAAMLLVAPVKFMSDSPTPA